MAHIPSGTTQELELVTFRQALEAADTPSDEYDIKKWIYAPNFYSEYRYILGTRGKKPLIWSRPHRPRLPPRHGQARRPGQHLKIRGADCPGERV